MVRRVVDRLIRRPVLRAATILSMVLLGFFAGGSAMAPRPARAARSEPNTVGIVPATTRGRAFLGGRLAGLFVAAGTVAAGAAVSKRGHDGASGNDDSGDDTVPVDEDSLMVISKEGPSSLGHVEYDGNDDTGEAMDGARMSGPDNIEEEVHELLKEEDESVKELVFVVAYMAVGVVAYSFVFENWG